MKSKFMHNNSVKVICFLLLSNLWLCSENLHAQYIPTNPLCKGITAKECLVMHIAEADVVFEGTILNSYGYFDSLSTHRMIYTCYRVDKIFKGEGLEDTLGCVADETEYFKDMIKFYTPVSCAMDLGIPLLGPIMPKYSKLFLGKYTKVDSSFSTSKKEVSEFVGLSGQLFFQIDEFTDITGEGEYSNHRFKKKVLTIHGRAKDSLEFSDATQVYDFVSSLIGKEYIDKTGKKVD